MSLQYAKNIQVFTHTHTHTKEKEDMSIYQKGKKKIWWQLYKYEHSTDMLQREHKDNYRAVEPMKTESFKKNNNVCFFPLKFISYYLIYFFPSWQISKSLQVSLLQCSTLDHIKQEKRKPQVISKLTGSNLFRRLNLKII